MRRLAIVLLPPAIASSTAACVTTRTDVRAWELGREDIACPSARVRAPSAGWSPNQPDYVVEGCGRAVALSCMVHGRRRGAYALLRDASCYDTCGLGAASAGEVADCKGASHGTCTTFLAGREVTASVGIGPWPLGQMVSETTPFWLRATASGFGDPVRASADVTLRSADSDAILERVAVRTAVPEATEAPLAIAHRSGRIYYDVAFAFEAPGSAPATCHVRIDPAM